MKAFMSAPTGLIWLESLKIQFHHPWALSGFSPRLFSSGTGRCQHDYFVSFCVSVEGNNLLPEAPMRPTFCRIIHCPVLLPAQSQHRIPFCGKWLQVPPSHKLIIHLIIFMPSLWGLKAINKSWCYWWIRLSNLGMVPDQGCDRMASWACCSSRVRSPAFGFPPQTTLDSPEQCLNLKALF